MVLDTSLLNTQQYKARIKGKVEQFREKSSALSYSYWKGSLLVALDYGRQLYFFLFLHNILEVGSSWNILLCQKVSFVFLIFGYAGPFIRYFASYILLLLGSHIFF